MKRYLIGSKEKLLRNTEGDSFNYQQVTLDGITNSFSIPSEQFHMEEIVFYSGNSNSYDIDERNVVFFYPPNEHNEWPGDPVQFYKGEKLVLDSSNSFLEISNLDELLLQMVRIFNRGLDEKIVFAPYWFMLKLEDKVVPNYRGRASLLITDGVIRVHNLLDETDFDKVQKHFINHFLNNFIGWNFGLSVQRNETLHKEVEDLNQRVIDMGIREWAGSTYNLVCSDTVQHHEYLYNKMSKRQFRKELKKEKRRDRVKKN